MHLVAQSPTVIAAGPSNYISGLGGKPQDTVFYIDCAGRIGGGAYIGVPRIVMQRGVAGYHFNRHFSVSRIRHLGTASRSTLTATVSISGSVIAGAINEVVHVAAPGCLAQPITVRTQDTDPPSRARQLSSAVTGCARPARLLMWLSGKF